jgi:hypothetical protein
MGNTGAAVSVEEKKEQIDDDWGDFGQAEVAQNDIKVDSL